MRTNIVIDDAVMAAAMEAGGLCGEARSGVRSWRKACQTQGSQAMITVDSGVWIAFFRGQETRQTRLLDILLDDSSRELVMLDLVLMEVLRGFRHDPAWQGVRDLLAPLPVVCAGGQSVAMRAAGICRDLRSRGTTVRSAVDLMVGAWCIENDCPLLHDDRDFHHMEGLQAWTV